ncbi:UDP-N-acetylmuramate dehydrogenase [Nocardioides sp.]|uniref:UDP-N-acetylmuramate dehydrogenase n=1 Tax=Nocardioides sp. TaxID=35761 RepID=UPI003D10635C
MPELLADHTTLRLGGPAGSFVEATTEDELIAAIREADTGGTPVLVLSGGSNLVVADAGFPGLVVKVATQGIEPDVDETDAALCGGVVVRVAAGESWDRLVARAVESHWVGIEALAGIPGAVGSTPIQNVGAYGQEVAQTLASVRVWDRRLQGVRTFANAECAFGYRHSRFKADPQRFVVLSVDFQFRVGDLGAPVAYAELARTLGVEQGARAPLAEVRRAVLGLRAAKGMVLDPSDHDTWSAGSFFTNPMLTAEQAAGLPQEAPRWVQPDGSTKTSAAWLIEHAGFARGHGNDRVSLSTKHTLALTNRGSATTADLLRLALEVRDGVELRFGVRLVNEPVLVGCRLD